MKKEYLKTAVLGILIIGCIIQTTTLWLGGMLSHNFLEQNLLSQQAIDPTDVWLLTASGTGQGSKSALAYPMSKTRKETAQDHERLIIELQELLKTIPEDVEINRVQDINWDELFSVSGIVYEYSIPVGLQEITGIRIEEKELQQIVNIEKIFLQSNSKFEKELTIHMMDMENNQLYTLEVPGNFEEFSKIYDNKIVSEEEVKATKYQPSAVSNMRLYIEGNTFMPIASNNIPIVYPVLEIRNPISTHPEKRIEHLDSYVNGFFLNPLLKDIEYKEDGRVIFSEIKGAYVVYNPVGTLEYVNMAPKNQGYSTLLGAYNTALDFIGTTTAIQDSIRDELYLSNVVKEKDNSYTCYFDMNYQGHDVVLSSKMQEKLGIESLVQVTVKNNQVISAKMSVLQILPKQLQGEIHTEMLTSEYVDPINKGLEEINEAGYESIVFEDSKAMYLIDHLSGSVYLTRGILFDDKWYYLE